MVSQKQDADGNLIGRSNQNPILDTCLYEEEYPWGENTEFAANIIAESMYAQCDVHRNEYLLLLFSDHRKNDSALNVEDQKIRVGFGICCEWKDGSTSWEKLSSHPIQVAKYALAQCIQHDSAFNWWDHHVLKKRDRIISMLK